MGSNAGKGCDRCALRDTCQLIDRLMNYTPISRSSDFKDLPSKRRRATDTGRLNLRGPALPGIKESIPFRSSAEGRWEWPLMTAQKPAAAGSRSSL